MAFYDQLVTGTDQARTAFMRIPILQRALRGNVTRDEYLSFLGQAYHHVRHTVSLMMACGAGLAEDKGWLRQALSEYISEEMGHEQWILDDIRASGGDPDAARLAAPRPATELMVAYAYDVVQRRNPVGFFGMVFVLEGTSVALASQAAATIRETLDLPGGAVRYLTSHGALDRDHLAFFERLMNRVDDPADQAMIRHCAGMFYRLYGDIFHSLSAS
jgi:thiaminase